MQVLQERCYAPVDSLILDNCQHSPQFDKAEETLEAVVQFTQRLTQIETNVVHIPSR